MCHNQTNASLSPSKAPSSVPSNSSDAEEFIRTKQVFERLFPDIPSDVEYDAWLNSLSSHIEQLQQQQQQSTQTNSIKRKTTTTTNITNHQNGDEEDSSSEETITGNGTHHYKDNGVKLSPSTEELVFQNAQLKSTVDEYKLIVADTVSFFLWIFFKDTISNFTIL